MSGTFVVAQAIKALAATATWPPLGNGAATTYKTLNIGALHDYTEVWPALEIEGREDESVRAAIGGKIRDTTGFLLRSVVPYTKAATTAEQDIYTMRDALVPIFQAHATLGATPGVVRSSVLGKAGRFRYAQRNGVYWRIHEFQLEVVYEYTVTIVP